MSLDYTIQLGNQFGILLFQVLLKLFHLSLNILETFVHGPCRLLPARSFFIFFAFPLSLLKFRELYLKNLIILSYFGG